MKRCRICKEKFTPSRPLQPTCGFECHIKYADQVIAKSKAKQAKEEKRADKAKRESLKTRSDYMKDAQREFNRYVRFRDRHQPCICCGNALQIEGVGGGFDAGHFRSVGSAPHLRFNEDNVHGQRKQCNRWGAGRAIDYRRGLIERIGSSRVEALEADQEPRKLTIEDLKQIIQTYRAKWRELEKT